ncbi:MAG TPA: hypothetical protein VMR41_00930 [Patescibacteria group bacterium]|nr:hypothetical protein [Patescibacteria group bacterium]
MSLENEQRIGSLTGESLVVEPRSIIGQDRYVVLSRLMTDYGAGVLSTSQVIDILTGESANGTEFHFNLNTDIQRLLIHKPPFKITLSTTSDSSALRDPHIDTGESNDAKISVGVEEINKGQEYEDTQLLLYGDAVKGIIGNRKMIGLYGQLSFPASQSVIAISKYFTDILSNIGEDEYAVLHSGSLVGTSGIAHEVIKNKRLFNIGIVPHSIEHLVERSNFSNLIIEGEDWGDASYLFGGLPDEIVFAGGGYWSFLEYQKAVSRNKTIRFLDFEGARYCREFNDGIPKQRIEVS